MKPYTLFTFLLIISKLALAQFDAESLYVSQNYQILYPDSVQELSLFEEPADKYSFFLVGEKHDHRGNREIELMLLKHHIANHDIKFYLLENSFSGEYLLKKFLALPDTNLESNPYTTLLYKNKKKDFEEYYEPLYQLYHSLDEAKKPKLRGIDLEMNLGQAFRTLGLILSQHDSKDTLIHITADLLEKGGKARGKRKRYRTAETLDTLFRNNKTFFKKTLNDDFGDFKRIVRGISAGKAWLMTLDTNNYQRASEMREVYMVENIMKLLKKHPKAKYFGQFGITHVVDEKLIWLDKVNNWRSLAWLLENELDQKVCKTIIFYPKTYSKKVKYCAIQEEYEDLFMEFADEKFTLFNLNKPDSPFRLNDKPIKREYCKSFEGRDYPIDISLEFNYLIINNYFQF